MKRTLLSLAAGVLLAVLVVAAAVLPAAAEPVSQVGWWTRNPLAQAPEGGFAVAKAPDGDLTVAALGVFATGEVTKATLILTEADAVNASGAALQVCFTPNEWQAGANQAWAERPKAECDSASAELKRNATSGTWAGDVLNVISAAGDDSTSISMMVVPAEESNPVGFELRFKSADLQIEQSEDDFSGGVGDSDFSSGSDFSDDSDFSSGSDFSGGSGSGQPGTDFGSSTFPAPAAPAEGSAPSDPATTPDVGSDGDEEETIGGEDLAITAAPTSTEATGNTALQAVFFVGVAVLAGTAAGYGRYFLRERASV